MVKTLTLVIAVMCPAAVFAQGGGEVKLNTQLARVVEVTLHPHQPANAPGHPNRVLVFRDAGRISRTSAGQTQTIEFKAGEVRFEPASGPAVVENATDRPIEIVEIELRNTPKVPPLVMPPLDPPVADAKHYSLEFENDQVRVLRVRYGPHEKGGLHEHVRERVVVNLSPSLRARFGNVTVARASTHSEQNSTDQVQERLAVELK